VASAKLLNDEGLSTDTERDVLQLYASPEQESD